MVMELRPLLRARCAIRGAYPHPRQGRGFPNPLPEREREQRFTPACCLILGAYPHPRQGRGFPSPLPERERGRSRLVGQVEDQDFGAGGG